MNEYDYGEDLTTIRIYLYYYTWRPLCFLIHYVILPTNQITNQNIPLCTIALQFVKE